MADAAPLLAALTEPLSPSLQHAATSVDAHALRHEGSQGFLIYTGRPQETVYSMPLTSKAGNGSSGRSWPRRCRGLRALSGQYPSPDNECPELDSNQRPTP